MRFLVLIRHGDYDSEDRINARGTRQMLSRVGDVKLLLGLQVKLLSSTATRAMESARVLARALEVEVEPYPVLWSDNDHPTNYAAVLELVREHEGDCDVLILLTHLEYAQYFPRYMGKEVLGMDWKSLEVQRGEGVVIDTQSLSLKQLR